MPYKEEDISENLVSYTIKDGVKTDFRPVKRATQLVWVEEGGNPDLLWLYIDGNPPSLIDMLKQEEDA